MNDQWHYLTNQFLNVTVGNYKKMMKLSTYHHAYLKQQLLLNPDDTEFIELNELYNPVHLLYKTKYIEWHTAAGHQKSETFGLSQMLEQLIKEANRWTIMIQNIQGFEKGTKNYITLFPNGLESFNTGTIMARINAVLVLSQALVMFTDVEEIIPIKQLISEYYIELDTARSNQEGAKGNTKSLSKEVDHLRIIVARGQYVSLAILMRKYCERPEMINSFFELNILRNSGQIRYTGTVMAGKTKTVLIRTFDIDDELRFKITSAQSDIPTSQITFHLATVPNGTDSEPIHVEANTAKLVVDITQFGITEYDTHRYLTAINDSSHQLQYAIELL